ncbi:MAG: efflux RND transporter permease subunit [Rickettsiales bacterium]|jgi:multidrug efflux pump|nr:efflux RND transporter permease subunit [Rickettsiales bacterium]
MNKIFANKKSVLTIFLGIVVYGMIIYMNIPKEAFPDVKIPYVITQVTYRGMSPEDGETMIAKKLENEFKSVENVKEITSNCFEGGCQTVIEFRAGSNSDKALADVREKVDLSKANLPTDIDEPVINEFSTSQFAILVVNLAGAIPERELLNIANNLKDEIEAVAGILEVEIGGDRNEQVEILVDPVKLSAYNISLSEFAAFLNASNVLIPAGNLNSDTGQFPIKVPGLLDNLDDIQNLPVKVNNDSVTRLKDIAVVRRNYEDMEKTARINYTKAVTLNVKKRAGANIISTVKEVKQIIEKSKDSFPQQLVISYTNDFSKTINDMLMDLNNSVLLSIILVIATVILMLGRRSGLLVGLSIPVSFLLGILAIYLMGLTINMVVLFGLVLSVGILVDGAIVVTEEADRRMEEGEDKVSAYLNSSKRMALPIISSTATTLAVFIPLLFWPGIAGEFLRYLPLTVISILLASLIVALVLVPTIGSITGKLDKKRIKEKAAIASGERKDKGIYVWYERVLRAALTMPKKILIGVLIMLVAVFFIFGKTSKGIEFFPNQEPDFVSITVNARGNLSIKEKDDIIKQVEDSIKDIPHFKTVYAQAGVKPYNSAEDTIGYIQLELKDWDKRPKADKIIQDMKARTSAIAGVKINIEKQKDGPSQGKPIEVEISSSNLDKIPVGINYILNAMDSIQGFSDTEDSRPLPGIQWEIKIDRAQAAKFGVDIASAGQVIQMLTNGIRFSVYHSGDSDEEIYIIARFPKEYRNFDQMQNLRITTAYGQVPLSNFITISPHQKISNIKRVDGQRVMSVKANVMPALLASNQVKLIKEYMKQNPTDNEIKITFKGEEKSSQESGNFIIMAFISAVALMAIILLLQFNSYYAVGMILLSVVLSTIGVFAGIILLGQPFSLIMHGLGVISLAGIVVNNNIILIDTYDEFKNQYKDKNEAILKTGTQRLRPVLLTTITTILGMVPMAIGLNIDFFNFEITLGNPSTTMWMPLAQSICFGLTFATILTLIITPCLLALKKGR